MGSIQEKLEVKNIVTHSLYAKVRILAEMLFKTSAPILFPFCLSTAHYPLAPPPSHIWDPGQCGRISIIRWWRLLIKDAILERKCRSSLQRGINSKLRRLTAGERETRREHCWEECGPGLYLYVKEDI